MAIRGHDMQCLECKNASECHSQIRGVMGLLRQGVSDMNGGRFLKATEALETAFIRLEHIDKQKNGR